MYTPIVGDKQPLLPIMTIMVYSYNSSMESNEARELEKKKRLIGKPISNGFRLENNSRKGTSMIKIEIDVYRIKVICIILSPPTDPN